MAFRLGAPWGDVVADSAGCAAAAGDAVLGRGGKLGGKTGWATLRHKGCFQDRPAGSAGKSLSKMSRKVRPLQELR